MGWINGLLPSVEDGVVKRQLCFASGDKCCVNSVTIKIRNCKEYFVYQFPRKVATCPSKYCTVYKQGGYTGSRIKLCFVCNNTKQACRLGHLLNAFNLFIENSIFQGALTEKY